MPKVTLIDFTGKGSPNETWHAADMLIYTKGTRLSLEPSRFEEVERLPMEQKLGLLVDMSKTIPSSWEFVDVVFLIEGVTRACAQQITRTRTASYAMQSQRVVAMDNAGAEVTNPFVVPEQKDLHETFEQYTDVIMGGYARLIRQGAEPQDARGILPMNINCNLLAKYNLRSFVDLVHSRSSLRTQSEYAEIVKDEVAALTAAWPWAGIFMSDPARLAIEELEAVARELGVTPGSGAGWRVAKAIDLLRRS